jgi:hypothetical protein
MKLRHVPVLVALAAIPALGAAEEQRVKLNPVAADVALDEFARVCLRDFPKAGRIRDAVGSSPFGYRRSDAGAAQQWQSPRAVVELVTADGRAERCTFDALLADRIEPGVLAGHVLKRIERTLGTQPPHRQVGQAIVWEWQMDGVAQQLTIDFAGGERQLALSMAWARGA